MTTTINIRAEVETVLGRELIGHEKAIVAHLRGTGMANPIDIARSMLQRHVANQTRLVELAQQELARQQAALDALPR